MSWFEGLLTAVNTYPIAFAAIIIAVYWLIRAIGNVIENMRPSGEQVGLIVKAILDDMERRMKNNGKTGI